ncbi:disease resistance protein RPP13-like [Cynara cardunculus var. scolymus]|uniref:Disease resistance protein n=1 Tax=Cynara cardunculus var. scolymus TaxID=59895 RepID=A0A103XDQ0_CYNCS|nr:disease resistance protein RPP13-like [Cynara cardunculus var. scolymus]KVH88773.1 Disease resistance protein [Cynara cardunculus var. scolymus]
MADAAVEFLLGNLKQLLVYNAHLISSVKDQVDSLCNDLRLLAAFVKDTTESRSKHAVVKELVRRIRIEVYKAEDIVDMYVVHASVQKSRTSLEKAFHITDYPLKLRTVGKEIHDIRRRVKEIYDNKMFGYEALGRRESVTRSPPAVEEDNVVGFDKEAEKMVGWLKAEMEELDVISVVGMGGLGKTTLVKKVYNDPSIQYEFFIRSWVYVSQVYSRREVFLKILHDVTRENKDTSEWSVNTIADELRIKLQDGRYLIVLDDVWTKQAWDDLKMVFPNTKNGSRILLTSRNKHVALHANTNRPPYQLRFLTPDESWELLGKKVFPRGSHRPKELEDLGKQIARKCYGLPLALVVIAGILRKKDKTRSWWEKVEEKVNTYVAMEPEQCMDVLALSYNHLPYDLKACFLYFGVFPEDFEIPVRKLIHIWVAEGFIQRIGDASAEEMAEENLQDLVDRNLVLVEKRRANGGIKTCRIHDMLHDLCVKQAEEEDFFKEIKGLEPSSYIKSVSPTVFRRLCVHTRVSDYVSSKPDSPHVRSFLCYAKEETVLAPDLITYFPGSFRLLRVLDVRPISFPRFPSIQLVHLRYIALLGTFKVLPAAISNLWNLQTLIVETTFRNIEVQADLWKLLQLRHVYTSAASDLPTPSSKSRKGVKDPLVNENLRTMSKVSPNTCTDVIFARTPNLQKLGVRGNLMSLMEEKKGSCKFDNIAKLTHLETLKLLNDTYPISPLDGKLHGLPGWYKFPPKLKKLTLSDTMLNWEHMSVLGKLPSLEVLKLGDNAFVGECWETPDGSFVRLRVLEIGKTDLAIWKAADDQFPQLQRLSLKHCEQLVEVPWGLGGITTLEVVELSWTSHSAVASAHRIQKNFKLVIFPPDQETQT